MSTININKLIQESIATHNGELSQTDPTDGLENALEIGPGIEVPGVDKAGAITKGVNIVKAAGGAVKDAGKAVIKAGVDAVPDSPAAKAALGVAAGAGALGAGLAAKKYLAKRKAAAVVA